MITAARCRYIVASCLNAHRWVAPGLVYLVGLALTDVNDASPLSNLAAGAVLLFPVTAWLTVTTVNDQDPGEAAITAAAVGGLTRARLAKVAVAATVGTVFAAISVIAAFAFNPTAITVNHVGVGLVAHLASVTGGLTVGSCCTRPLIDSPGWATLTISLLTAADLAIPGAPPCRNIVRALSMHNTNQRWLALGQLSVEVVTLAALVISVSTSVATRRA